MICVIREFDDLFVFMFCFGQVMGGYDFPGSNSVSKFAVIYKVLSGQYAGLQVERSWLDSRPVILLCC